MHAGGESLLGVLNGESTMDQATLVQSCDHIPTRAAWMAGSYMMRGPSCSHVLITFRAVSGFQATQHHLGCLINNRYNCIAVRF